MFAERHEDSYPEIERSFTAVRAALPAFNAAAFDAELGSITRTQVVDLVKLDEFLTGWWRIATIAARDPEGWQRIQQIGEDLEAGRRELGPTLAEVLARKGVQL